MKIPHELRKISGYNKRLAVVRLTTLKERSQLIVLLIYQLKSVEEVS